MARSVTEPQGVAAAGRAGIVEIVIPQQAKVQPRRIEVAAA